MWGKPEVQNQGQNPMSAPERSAAAPRYGASAPTVLGKAMRIVGEVSSEEDLFIDGELEGKLQLKNRLTIGPDSKVIADIRAREVEVFGSVRGNVEAVERIAIHTGATIVGDIKTAGIVIDDGAYFKGGIDICRGEPSAQPVEEKR
jgi:cytoskeletal protein CcmA (bactofilin family)